MSNQSKVLLVVNEKQESRAAELAEILEQEGILYEVAMGREEALRLIKENKYAGVYLTDCAVDMGSDRLPPVGVFELFDGQRGGRFDRYIASGLEVVMCAREQGLPVLVGDEESRLMSTKAFKDLGATTMCALTTDAYEQYQALVRLISPKAE